MEITIKMKTIDRIPLMIKIIKLHLKKFRQLRAQLAVAVEYSDVPLQSGYLDAEHDIIQYYGEAPIMLELC